MQFNSIEFLFLFLPVFLIVYFSLGQRLRGPVLILGSLAFYAFACGGNYLWVLWLLGFTFLSYFVQLSVGERSVKFLLVLCIAIFASFMTFFKVFDQGKYLPAGMSFYMFQMAAYLLDVFRKRITPEENFLAYAEQILLFPKLLSGPLMPPEQLGSQQHSRERKLENVYEGLRIMILGLALKVILANRLGGLWSQPQVIGYPHISPQAAWMALIAYAMQLYLDFYGYSLMAIGIGKMLGYNLPANFRDPYASRSVSEFYRRWHITLGAWFREYVYIPLGGNRRGMLRTLVNMAVVWFLTGLWHGVGGNYLLWAGVILLLIVNERLWLGNYLNKSRILSHVYLIFVILLSWIPFAVGNWDQMVIFAGRLFGLRGKTLNPRDYLDWIRMYAGLLLAGGFVMTPLPGKIWRRIRNSVLSDVLTFALFWLVVYYIATAAQDPFLYFRY